MYGVDLEAMQLWWEVFQVLELDKKSQLGLLILAQSGPVGNALCQQDPLGRHVHLGFGGDLQGPQQQGLQ